MAIELLLKLLRIKKTVLYKLINLTIISFHATAMKRQRKIHFKMNDLEQW